MKCMKCGADIAPGKKFCSQCGASAPSGYPQGLDFGSDLWNGGGSTVQTPVQQKSARPEGTGVLLLGLSPWFVPILGLLIGGFFEMTGAYNLGDVILIVCLLAPPLLAILGIVFGGICYKETGSLRAKAARTSSVIFLVVLAVLLVLCLIAALIESQRSGISGNIGDYDFHFNIR